MAQVWPLARELPPAVGMAKQNKTKQKPKIKSLIQGKTKMHAEAPDLEVVVYT